MPAYIRPLFCEGKGPFRWVALSGDPADIHATDDAILDLFGDQEHIARWIALAQRARRVPGPAGADLLAGLRRAPPRRGCGSTRWSRAASCAAPIVIGRDHLDAGSVASPERETEAMADGTDAVADWPLLNALVNTACGASWVSIHHGGGVGMGKSIHAGQVCVADGTAAAAERIRRVLTADPGMGIVRHADSGEPDAIAAARRGGVRMPMLDPADPTVSWRQHRERRARSCARRRTASPTCARPRRGARARRRRGRARRRPDRRLRRRRDATLRIDATGCAVLPGFVDCHTHLPFAGWRAEEYEMKVTGVPYEEIARRGGGIASSARAFGAAVRRGGARAGARPRGRDAADRHDDVRGQDRLRPVGTTPSAAPRASAARSACEVRPDDGA